MTPVLWIEVTEGSNTAPAPKKIPKVDVRVSDRDGPEIECCTGEDRSGGGEVAEERRVLVA